MGEAGAPSTPPAHLDYEVLRLIGRGGYGEVWLVRDKTGRHFACKVIYRVSFDSDRPYEREYEGIQKFEPVSRANDSQVNILHVGRRDEQGYFYYIMELGDDVVTGQQVDPPRYVPKTLGSELKRRGRLPAGECIRIGLSLSAALENLHEHGLIHRDIKPANIIFVNRIPKLADIGLVSNRDVTVSYVGTEGYIPPEGPGSAQADVYSLGKVLYELSTGRDRLDYPELPTDLGQESGQDALLELNAVVIKACATDLRERYRTAGELHADLTLLSGGKSVRQRNISERKRRTIGQVALAALLMVAVGLGVQKWRARSAATVPESDILSEENTFATTPSLGTQLARSRIHAGFEAFGLNDYPGAKKFAAAALTAAQNAHNAHLITEALFLSNEIARCEGAYQEIAPLEEVLANHPEDPQANGAVGKFLCLARNDWQAGLPMLARGNNEALRAAAQKEITGAGEAALGDSWWEAAAGFTGAAKDGFQRRAKHWYLRAIAKAKEPGKSALKTQLAERLAAVPSSFGEVHIESRVGNAQHIDLYANDVRWKSEGVSVNDRINQVTLGDLKGRVSKTIRNTGATRLFPEDVNFLTAQLKIDHKGKKRGNAKLEVAEDHVRVTLVDRPAGSSEVDVTVTFPAQP